ETERQPATRNSRSEDVAGQRDQGACHRVSLFPARRQAEAEGHRADLQRPGGPPHRSLHVEVGRRQDRIGPRPIANRPQVYQPAPHWENRPLNLREVQRNWNLFGQTDPYWAILTVPGKENNQWDPEDFFESGRHEIDAVM